MAKDEEKKNNKGFFDSVKKSNEKGKKLQIAAQSMIDNMTFSKTDVYAYYRISNDVFDFLSSDQKAALALRTSNALNALMANRQDPLDGHLIQTSIPFDLDAWKEQVVAEGENWNTGEGFAQFMGEQFNHLDRQQYMKKVSYIGVHLGKRGALDTGNLNFLEVGFKGAVDTVKQWLSAVAQTPNEIVTPEEEISYRRREKEIFSYLSTGNLRGQRATTEELILLIKRQFHPFPMPIPYLDVDIENRLGPGDLELETVSVVENKWRWLKITQMVGHMEVTGYRAVLSFAKFPRSMTIPGQIPFFYFPARLSLPIPFTLYSRFTLYPSAKMKKEVEKKRKEQRDELDNLMQAQDSYSSVAGGPSDFGQALYDINEISDILSSDKSPWVQGSYRICVEAATEEQLKEMCAYLKQEYENIDINLVWSAGDQKELFLEQMPGDTHRIQSFKQVTNLNMLGASGFNFSSDIGDPTFGDPTMAQ